MEAGELANSLVRAANDLKGSAFVEIVELIVAGPAIMDRVSEFGVSAICFLIARNGANAPRSKRSC